MNILNFKIFGHISEDDVQERIEVMDDGKLLGILIYDLFGDNAVIHLEDSQRLEFIEKIAGLKRDE